MIYKTILTLLTITLTLSLSASEPTVKLVQGAQYQIPKGYTDIDLLGDLTEGFVQFSSSDNLICLQKFSPELKKLSEKTFTITELEKESEIISIFKWKGSYYCIAKNHTRKTNTTKLIAIQFTQEDKSFSSKTKEILSSENRELYNISVCLNTDSSRLCISGDIEIDKKSKDNKRYMGLWVFNNELELNWTNKVHKGDWGGGIWTTIISTACDKNANFYFISKIQNGLSRDKKNINYEVLVFGKENTEPTVLPISGNNKFSVNCQFFTDNEKNLILAGYYSTNADKLIPDNLFIYKVTNNKLENYKKGTYELTADLLKQYYPNSDANDNKYTTVLLRNIVFNTDGSLLVIGEEYKEDSYLTSSGDSRFTYVHNSIVVHSIANDGSLKWAQKVGKHQYGNNNRVGLGFNIITRNNIAYAIFLDNIKNLNIKPDTYPAQHTAGYNGYLMEVRIDDKGVMSKKVILNTNEAELTIEVAKAQKVSENTLVLSTHKGVNKLLGGHESDGKPGKICILRVE